MPSRKQKTQPEPHFIVRWSHRLPTLCYVTSVWVLAFAFIAVAYVVALKNARVWRVQAIAEAGLRAEVNDLEDRMSALEDESAAMQARFDELSEIVSSTRASVGKKR